MRPSHIDISINTLVYTPPLGFLAARLSYPPCCFLASTHTRCRYIQRITSQDQKKTTRDRCLVNSNLEKTKIRVETNELIQQV